MSVRTRLPSLLTRGFDGVIILVFGGRVLEIAQSTGRRLFGVTPVPVITDTVEGERATRNHGSAELIARVAGQGGDLPLLNHDRLIGLGRSGEELCNEHGGGDSELSDLHKILLVAFLCP